jgi:class 3 adenylate cyclase
MNNSTINMLVDLIETGCVIAVFAYVVTRTQFFAQILDKQFTFKNQGILIVLFGALSIFGTYGGITLPSGAIANIRDLGPMVAGLVGGPLIGVGAGLIGGIHRYFLGGFVAFPCSLASVVAGFIGGFLYELRKKEFATLWQAIILAVFVECCHMSLVLLIARPYDEAVDTVRQVILPMIGANAAGITLFALIITNLIKERRTVALFGKYVSPQVASTIIERADKGELSMAGQKLEVTVLFADMRGFTKLSSNLENYKLVDTLNVYFSAVIECINANGGMVNKFAGDNIMAVWNAPQSQPEHAFLAVKTALDSQRAIEEVNQKFKDISPIEFGIGVNTGEAIAGSVGSEGRAEYTVIGDTVNLASRICGAAPGGRIWTSQQTFEKVKKRIVAKELDPQCFKGKEGTFTVYEVISLL